MLWGTCSVSRGNPAAWAKTGGRSLPEALTITGRVGECWHQGEDHIAFPGLTERDCGKKCGGWLALRWISGFWEVWRDGSSLCLGDQNCVAGADEGALSSPGDPMVWCSQTCDLKVSRGSSEDLALLQGPIDAKGRCSDLSTSHIA